MPLSGQAVFWIAAMIFFIIVEAVTVGLASIWFAIGSVAALICALAGGPVWLQVVWFVAVSALTLFLTRPLVKKYVAGRAVPTNADRNIGRTAVVTEEINNLAATGAVKVDGLDWTARSTDDNITIPKDSVVVIQEIRGVKLLVEPKEEF